MSAWLGELVRLVNRAALDSEPDRLHLHCAGLELGGKGVLLAAESGTGKSTLCTAALLAGWGYLTDEMVSVSRQHAPARSLVSQADHRARRSKGLLSRTRLGRGSVVGGRKVEEVAHPTELAPCSGAPRGVAVDDCLSRSPRPGDGGSRADRSTGIGRECNRSTSDAHDGFRKVRQERTGQPGGFDVIGAKLRGIGGPPRRDRRAPVGVARRRCPSPGSSHGGRACRRPPPCQRRDENVCISQLDRDRSGGRHHDPTANRMVALNEEASAMWRSLWLGEASAEPLPEHIVDALLQECMLEGPR